MEFAAVIVFSSANPETQSLRRWKLILTAFGIVTLALTTTASASMPFREYCPAPFPNNKGSGWATWPYDTWCAICGDFGTGNVGDPGFWNPARRAWIEFSYDNFFLNKPDHQIDRVALTLEITNETSDPDDFILVILDLWDSLYPYTGAYRPIATNSTPGEVWDKIGDGYIVATSQELGTTGPLTIYLDEAVLHRNDDSDPSLAIGLMENTDSHDVIAFKGAGSDNEPCLTVYYTAPPSTVTGPALGPSGAPGSTPSPDSHVSGLS